MAGARSREDARSETPLLEWVAAGVGLLLTLLVLGVIGREALDGETEQSPMIAVAATGITAGAPGYVLAFEASNSAGGTAAAVEIEAILRDHDTIVETGLATLDYVPGHGKARGGIIFTRDPRQHTIEIRALGFQIP